MSVGFGFSLPALVQYGGGGNNPFGQLGPTLDLSFAGTVTDTNDPNGYTLNTNFIAPQYQVAADYTIWETNVGLVSKTFSQIITFTRASTATFTGSNGLIQSAAIDVPRFDYDPVTLAAKGLLIEEQRTNLITYSEQFDNAAWAKGNTTVTADSAVAPDGATTADKLVENTATAIHSINVSASVSFTSGVFYTLTVYAKAAERYRGLFTLSTGTTAFGSIVTANFDLQAGTITAATGSPTVSIASVGNGWYRISISKAAIVTAIEPGSSGLRMADATGATTYTGDGTSGLFIWGAQLEAGAFPTSYIPTVASQVTRSADAASVNTLSPWYNATEGTLYASVSGFSVGTVSSALASITDNPTASNWILISGLSTTAAGVTSAGVSQANFTSLSSVASGGSVAIAYKANDFAAVVNGGTVATDVSGSVPSSVSVLRIGGFGSNPGPLNGHLRRITYYPRRLSDVELQAITA